jgi:hypothetical protein
VALNQIIQGICEDLRRMMSIEGWL